MDIVAQSQRAQAQCSSPRAPVIERNGLEYLLTTPEGGVFVALTRAEAEAIATLWRAGTHIGSDTARARD